MTTLLWLLAIWWLGTQLIPEGALRDAWAWGPWLAVAGLAFLASWCEWRLRSWVLMPFGIDIGDWSYFDAGRSR